MLYRNATLAFVGELAEVTKRGRPVTVRGMATHELLARTVSLEHPRERFITVPGRRNDVFATIAETMWVLAGRDDVSFLRRYLERAPNYSDDGLTWRGGYGPRLRNWEGVDQLEAIRDLLTKDPESRRAVAVLFDPARDFLHETKDVPCNNWLHFLIREGRLDLNVVVRSNDVLWGFSGINTFEWSVLHEMMAFWLGVEVGRVTFFISSLHLYDEYGERARKCLDRFGGRSGYEDGWGGAEFSTPWNDFANVIEQWFAIEGEIAAGGDASVAIAEFPDPLLRDFLRAIQIKAAKQGGADENRLRAMVDELGHSDLAFALHEQLFRDSAELLPKAPTFDTESLRSAITELHRVKDASYGTSWKKRGELISILANIARKSDRIENVVGGAPLGSEALIDTAADLLVYAVKYETFLADLDREVAVALFEAAEGPYSDGPIYFTALLATRSFDVDESNVLETAMRAVSAFDELDHLVREGSPTVSKRAAAARRLSDAALALVIAVARQDPDAVAHLQREAAV